MTRPQQYGQTKISSASQAATTVAAFLLTLVLTIAGTQPAQAQTFQIVHYFTGADGHGPIAGLTIDTSGSLYGTTAGGGNCQPAGCGTAFKLTRNGSGWSFATIYQFQQSPDGNVPESPMVFGSDGSLYGTTAEGGYGACYPYGCGTVFKLTSANGGWTESVLYRFNFRDGGNPTGDLAFDAAGNLYGTTGGGGTGYEQCSGGCLGDGVVYRLDLSGGIPAETVLYDFYADRVNDGIWPVGGVRFDSNGNLYGTAAGGGQFGYGIVFRLTPTSSGWAEGILYNFRGGTDGALPFGGLVLDRAGNLYGSTTFDGLDSGPGSVFELARSNGNWVHTVLYDFPNFCRTDECHNVGGPYSSPTLDAAGNLYGTTFADGAYGYGSVFKLTRSENGWSYTTLHDFTGQADGASPWGSVIVDSSGNVLGTAAGGGINNPACYGGCGVVWEITP